MSATPEEEDGPLDPHLAGWGCSRPPQSTTQLPTLGTLPGGAGEAASLVPKLPCGLGRIARNRALTGIISAARFPAPRPSSKGRRGPPLRRGEGPRTGPPLERSRGGSGARQRRECGATRRESLCGATEGVNSPGSPQNRMFCGVSPRRLLATFGRTKVAPPSPPAADISRAAGADRIARKARSPSFGRNIQRLGAAFCKVRLAPRSVRPLRGEIRCGLRRSPPVGGGSKEVESCSAAYT